MTAARELARHRWDMPRPTRDPKTMGERLRAAREKAGLTQSQVAEALKVSASSVKQWETDRSVPRDEQLQALAEAISADLGWLLTGIFPSADGSI